MATVVSERPRGAGVGVDSELDAQVNAILGRHACVGLAVGLVRNGRLEFYRAHGRADVAAPQPITEDTVFRIGSITKTFTALAVMQLWEHGLLDLDAPAGYYLRAFRLIPARASFRPATVRHLLTHTAGLPELLHPSDVFQPLFGELVRAGQPAPAMADYYRGGLTIHAQPGSRFIYTDHGFAALAQIVEDVSGMPFDRYLRERIFLPLGMADTDLIRSGRLQSRLATGYDLRSDGPRAVADYEVVTAGGGGAYSTSRDMARYLAALMGGGANEYGRVVEPATLAAMFEPQYQPHPAVVGVGAAFYLLDFGRHLVVEHGGILPGFTSEILVAPDDGVGLFAFTNGASDAMFWLLAEVGGLLRQALGVADEILHTDLPQHPEVWPDICGWYPLAARPTDVRARLAIGAGAEVFVRHGQLTLRILSPIPAMSRGFVLHPDDERDPLVFRIDLGGLGVGTARVAFSREPGSRTMVLHLDLGKPLSMRRHSGVLSPGWLARRVLAALLVGVVAGAVVRRRRSPGVLRA